MPDLGYDTGALREGAGGHTTAALAADTTATTLAGFAVDAAAFGSTASGAAFAGGVETARTLQGCGAGAEAAGRASLAVRVAAAARMGDDLTGESAAVAASVPTDISAAM